MTSIRDTNIIYIQRELIAFSKMQDALVRTSPITTQIGFILIMPYEPPAPLEETQGRGLEISKYLRIPTNIEGSVRFENSGRLFYPPERPVNILLLRFKIIPFRFFYIVRRISKNEINRRIWQRCQPRDGIPNPYFTICMRIKQ